MKKIAIISLFAAILMANNLEVNATVKPDVNTSVKKELNTTQELTVEKAPNVYAALGDVIYGNVNKIVKLKELETFQSFSEKINSYAKSVEKAKAIGFDIESGNKNVDEITYLKILRSLSKENDYFIRSVKSAYKSSIEKEDNKLFLQTVNSGLLNTDKKKDQIVEYYLKHSADINVSGIIQKYLDEDTKLKIKKKSYDYAKAKRLRDEAKIRRIREEDRRKQAELEKELTEEVQQKKIEILENQKKELFH